MKVLVSAYACEPGKGSEPEVGWQWARQIARFHETWVITRANNRPLIEEGLEYDPNPNLHFVYVDLPPWYRFWKKGGRGVHLYHQLWQYHIVPLAHTLHREHRFDICHHITFGVVWHPSFLYRLPVRFVWGPFGGGEDAYATCLASFSFRGKLTEIIRRRMSQYFFNIDPVVRRSFAAASLLLARTEGTFDKIPSKYRSKTKIFLETGYGYPVGIPVNKNRVRREMFIASRLIPYKNIETALLSMKIIREKLSCARLHIFGTGPLMGTLKRRAAQLELRQSVIFHGQIDRAFLQKNMRRMDVLIYPAVRDGGTHSIMEAMALGIPVVCLDNAGPGYMVDNSSGIKVTGKSHADIVERFADAAIELLTNDERYSVLSMGAIERVKNHFLWNHIGDRINALYRDVCSVDVEQTTKQREVL